MARHVLARIGMFAAVVVLATLAGGCSAAGPMLSVVRGNFAYGRGDYQTALVHYLSAEQDTTSRGWLLFNSGNVYYALGEQEAALSAWDEARKLAGDPGASGGSANGSTLLIHASSYNRGVLLYQRGEYRAAYDEFRYALSVNGSSVPAKVNLELALQKIRSAEQAQQSPGGKPAEGTADDAGPSTLRILEYVRRKESQRWYANQETDDTSHPRDW